MGLPPRLIEFMAFRIAQMLIERGDVVVSDPNRLEEIIEKAIRDELALEDQLDEEVRRILARYADEIQRSQAEYHELFRKIKQRLAKERGIVL